MFKTVDFSKAEIPSLSEIENAEGRNGRIGRKPLPEANLRGAKNGRTGAKFAPVASHSEEYRPPTYPIEALGLLADVGQFLRDDAQVPACIAGQSLLAAASLLVQDFYNVETLAGPRPTSLFLLSLAESGAGKSVCDDIALRAIKERDRMEHSTYTSEHSRWESLSPSKRDGEAAPVQPYRLMRDTTVQGIARAFKTGLSSQGNFTDEAGACLTGWGMSAENRTATMAGLNGFWDGGCVSITRQGDGRTQLYDKRLAVHWMAQPAAVQAALSDPLGASIGLWPRFLAAWPGEIAPRKYRPFDPGSSKAVTLYWQRCAVLMTERFSIDCESKKLVRLSTDAKAVLISFFEEMELSRSEKSPLHDLRPFALRGAEQVCRIAGVLAAFENHSRGVTDFEIDGASAANAVSLFRYSLQTWLDFFGGREDAINSKSADQLHDWLARQPGRMASESQMLKIGPKRLRSRDRRDVALALLQQQGRIDRAFEVLPGGGARPIPRTWVAM